MAFMEGFRIVHGDAFANGKKERGSSPGGLLFCAYSVCLSNRQPMLGDLEQPSNGIPPLYPNRQIV